MRDIAFALIMLGLIPLAATEDEARRRLAQFADIVRRTVPFERLPLPARRWSTSR